MRRLGFFGLPSRPYLVISDATKRLSPSVKFISPRKILKVLSQKSVALWLGEQHHMAKDHSLQAQLIREIHGSSTNKNLAIGLEQVQIQFQSALDEFTAGTINLDELGKRVEWETRWKWPLEGYKPDFEAAKELDLPLIAPMPIPKISLKLKLVAYQLPPQVLGQYISDRNGFAEFAKPIHFSAYANYVIRPSYDMHRSMGLLDYNLTGQKLEHSMSFRNFFSGRILWDEAIANAAVQWSRKQSTTKEDNSQLIGLVGAGHVKFQNGIPGRYARMMASSLSTSDQVEVSVWKRVMPLPPRVICP